jgi:cysteine dioxygenase
LRCYDPAVLDTTRRVPPASASKARGLTLEEFIHETMRIPQAELKLPQLEELFLRLALPDALMDQHAHFGAKDYCRNLLCRTPRFDMLVLGWREGQLSSIHDHLDSLNCTRVIRGTLRQRLFRAVDVDDQGKVSVQRTEEERIEPGALARLDAGGIHQMGNLDPEPLVTLHVYSAPLSEITVYEPESLRSYRKRLRYSLEDDFVAV